MLIKSMRFIGNYCPVTFICFITALLLSAGLQAQAIATDESLPHFRFALEDSSGRIYEGGSAKEATVKQFPISKGIAGVSMILKPGGLRELHWHAMAAEWAYVITGHCRVTVIDPEGHTEIKDFGPGDVWYFPRGQGHSIQGLGNEECHFILTFDNGNFSEFSTFSITDWMAQTPVSVLAKNFHMKQSDFSNFPKKEAYIACGPIPPPLSDPLPFSQSAGPLSHGYRLGAQKPLYFEGGTFSMVDQKLFPISSTMAGAILELKPKAMRELHWHPNSDEWQYYISGKARMTVFLSNGKAVTEEFKPGDVGYVPQGCGHYVENLSDETCKMLAVFNSGNYQEIALSDWIASNPNGLLQTNFGAPKDIINKFPAKSAVLVGP